MASSGTYRNTLGGALQRQTSCGSGVFAYGVAAASQAGRQEFDPPRPLQPSPRATCDRICSHSVRNRGISDQNAATKNSDSTIPPSSHALLREFKFTLARMAIRRMRMSLASHFVPCFKLCLAELRKG